MLIEAADCRLNQKPFSLSFPYDCNLLTNQQKENLAVFSDIFGCNYINWSDNRDVEIRTDPTSASAVLLFPGTKAPPQPWSDVPVLQHFIPKQTQHPTNLYPLFQLTDKSALPPNCKELRVIDIHWTSLAL